MTPADTIIAMARMLDVEAEVRAQLNRWLHAGGLASDLKAHRVSYRNGRCSAWVEGPRMPKDRGFVVSWSGTLDPIHGARITLFNRSESKVFARADGVDVVTAVMALIEGNKLPQGALPLQEGRCERLVSRSPFGSSATIRGARLIWTARSSDERFANFETKQLEAKATTEGWSLNNGRHLCPTHAQQ